MGNVAKNSSLYLLSNLCLKATSFLLLPFYSYLITPDVYGRVFVANALMTFLTMLMPMALNSAVHRYYFECKSLSEERTLYSTVVWTISISVVFFATVILVPINFWAGVFEIPPLYILLVTVSSSFQAYYSIITSYLYAKQQAKTISIVTIVVGAIQIIVQLALVINMEDKAMALLLTYLLSAVVSFCVFIFFSHKYLIFTYDYYNVKKYLVFGFSQLPSDISTTVVSLLDRFILNKYVNAAAVGLYGIGYTLGAIPSLIFTSINQALVPDVFGEFKKNTNEAFQKAADKVGLTFTLITMLFSLLIVYSNHLILVLSERYKESGTIMCMILFALLIDTYRVLFMYPMQYNVRYVKIKSAIWVLAAIISTTLNLLLIPYYSIYGAALSFIVSNSVTFLLIIFFSHKAIPLPYNIKRLIIVFVVSLLFSLSVFAGTSFLSLLIKIVISVVYCHILYKISIKKYTNITFTEIKNKIKAHV